MARIRTVKPEFWTDSKTVQLSPLARLLFIGAWNFADDYGALEPDPLQLKLRVLPAEQCDPEQLVDELLKAGLLVEMTNGDEMFWVVAGWEKHQKVDKRSNSQFGDPDSWSPAEPSPNPPDSPRALSSPRPGREGIKEGNGKEKDDDADAPPSTPPDNFDDFWDRYPRHAVNNKTGGGGSRKKAHQRWRRMTVAERDAALAAVDNYREWVESPDGEYPAHATTWLNEARWEQWQEPAEIRPRDGPTPLPDRDTTDWTEGWQGRIAQ